MASGSGLPGECSLANQPHEVIHIAFLTDEPEKLAKRMVYGGAKIIGSIQKNSNGDVIIDLLDPYNFPIRLIKREKSVLVK